MTDVKVPTLVQNIAPLPTPTRGFPVHLTSAKTKNGDILAYSHSNEIFLRDLKNLDQTDIFKEHKHAARVCKFSKNGLWCASGDMAGEVQLWEVGNKKVKVVVPVGGEIWDIDWSDDGKKCVAVGAGTDTRARVFTYDSGNNAGSIDKHTKTITSVAYRKSRPYSIATTSEDLTVNFYEGPPFAYKFANKAHTRYPNCVRFAPDDSVFITVGSDSKIIEYDGKTGAQLREITDADAGHKAAIYSFAFSPDGKQFVTASADATCKVWDLAEGKVACTFVIAETPSPTEDPQMAVLWHADGTIISLSLSGQLNFMDTATNSVSKKLQGLTVGIVDAVLDRTSKQLFTVETNGNLTRTDLTTGMGFWYKSPTALNTVALSGSSVVTTSMGATGLKVSDQKGGEFGALGGGAVSGDGKAICVAKSSDTVYVVCSVSAKKIEIFQGGVKTGFAPITYEATCIAINADDSTVAVGSKDKNIYIYAASGTSLTQTKVLKSDAPITGLTFKPDTSNILVSGDKGSYIYVWDVATGVNKVPNGWKYHSGVIYSLNFSPDGSQLISAGQDGICQVWRDFTTFDADKRLTVPCQNRGACFADFLDESTIVVVGINGCISTYRIPA